MRVLLAIGCNDYESATTLDGAEADATRMFQALANLENGWYDGAHSRLLLSPTLDQARLALREMLFSGVALDTFTFFFAGHGGVNKGSFYLWVRDTNATGQSASALALGDLFRYINEAGPRQTNIIIDACEAGGLIEDLGVLLKPELLGDVDTPALTLLATSARNQAAGETPIGGDGTNAILDCIEGRQFVNDAHSALDLVEIGRQVSMRLQPQGQNPVVWGLNLYGPPSFCRNPRHDRDGKGALRDLVKEWPAEADAVIQRNHDHLWTVYTSVAGDWDEEEFQQVIRTVIQSSGLRAEQAAGVAERLATTLLQRCAQSDDPFRGALVMATIAASLLPFVAAPHVEASVRRLLRAASVELNKALSGLIADLTTERFALLSATGGGLPDLYYLPLRVSKVLGWAAVAPLLCQSDADKLQAESQFAAILRLLLEHYPSAVVALNDAQAPFWCVALARAAKAGLMDEGEQLAGMIFHSLTLCEGRLARWDLAPESVFEYTLARARNDFSEAPDFIERPIETLTVLLRASSLYGLGQVFDEGLWRLDGVSFSAFIPPDFSHYNALMMTSGESRVWKVGHEVFRVEEFAATWPSSVPRPRSTVVAALSVISSLILPNRQPWFLLEPGTM